MRTPAHFNGKSSTYFGLTVKPPLSVPGTPLWEPNLPPGARREGGGGGWRAPLWFGPVISPLAFLAKHPAVPVLPPVPRPSPPHGPGPCPGPDGDGTGGRYRR